MRKQTGQSRTGVDWGNAKGLTFDDAIGGPQGALVPDENADCDHVAVVYNKGDTPPQITVTDLSGSVQQVNADGVAVAVVARSSGPQLCADDVLLVERSY